MLLLLVARQLCAVGERCEGANRCDSLAMAIMVQCMHPGIQAKKSGQKARLAGVFPGSKVHI